MQAVGWIGSALLILSLTQSRALRFRVFNILSSVFLIAYNAGIGATPQIAMNAALVAINLWKIIELRRPVRPRQGEA